MVALPLCGKGNPNFTRTSPLDLTLEVYSFFLDHKPELIWDMRFAFKNQHRAIISVIQDHAIDRGCFPLPGDSADFEHAPSLKTPNS